jgi:hypothetical protein
MVLVTSAWLGRCSQQVPQSFNVVYMYFYNIYIYIYIYICLSGWQVRCRLYISRVHHDVTPSL